MAKKKKHYYTKKKFFIKSEEPLYNPAEVIKCAKNMQDNLWLNFISDVVYERQEIPLSCEENIANILLTIQSNQTINKIVRELQLSKDYNPYISKIPLWRLSENTRNLIKKKQNYIQRHWDYRKELIGKHRILIMYNHRKRLNFGAYDVIFLFRGNYTEIRTLNEDILTSVYKKLIKKEPGIWEIYDGKIMNKEHSSFNIFNTIDITDLFT